MIPGDHATKFSLPPSKLTSDCFAELSSVLALVFESLIIYLLPRSISLVAVPCPIESSCSFVFASFGYVPSATFVNSLF